MQRIDTSSAVDIGGGKNGFTNGNPATSQPATDLSSDWCNAIQEEIANVIETASIALDENDNAQLHDAILALIAANASAPDIATKAEAESGVDNGVFMTPLRTKESIDFNNNIKHAFIINGGSSPSITTVYGAAVSIVRNSSGNYTVTLPSAISNFVPSVCGHETTGVTSNVTFKVKADSPTNLTIDCEVGSGSGGGKDFNAYVVIFGA